MAAKSFLGAGYGALLVLAMVLLGSIHLKSTPALWWDEGWTLCDARNWVELGHYGCLIAGEPGPSTLSAAFPVVAPVALSFRLFGVGIWQARMVGLLYTAGAVALLYYLTDRLFKRPVAIATLVILLLMPHAHLHPVFMGKQVLAETPSLFFLLAGYTFFFLTLRKSPWFLPLALLFWGVALKTKAQVTPFWVVSLVAPLAVALFRRRWRAIALLAVGLLGSLLAAQGVLAGQRYLLSGHMLSRAPVSGLYGVTALVQVGAVRWGALAFVLLYGLPTLLGLGYGAREWKRSLSKSAPNDAAQVLRLMLLSLAGSWFAWYVLLSAGWPRYLFPATFVGSPFAASALYDLTGGFRFLSVLNQGASALREKGSWHKVRQVTGVVLIMAMVSLTIVGAVIFYGSYFGKGDTSVLQVTRFFNTATPADTLIETFDSELFLLLDRPYHYPPAQLTVALIRREYLGQDLPFEYDPLAADPDYLVVGPFSRWWRLYEPIIEAGAFRLHQTTGLYEIYERVR